MLKRMASSAHSTPKFGMPIETGLASIKPTFVKKMVMHTRSMHNSENKKYKADSSNFFLNALNNMLLEINVKKK
jgi:hypothetical protein